MAGNTFGKIFSVTSFGESHGVAIGGVIDGCPPNIEISENDLQSELDRRKPGQSKYTTTRQESDAVKILSGIFEGKTTGTPISFVIYNENQRSGDYSDISSIFRPAHADFTYQKKYGIRDYRGGGRASARETAVRVAAGSIAKKVLKSKGVQINAFLSQIGDIKIDFDDFSYCLQNPFFCPNNTQVKLIEALVDKLRSDGDSIGAQVTLVADGVPTGWGSPVYDKLDACMAYAMMGINAAKAVSIGNGFEAPIKKGSEFRDEIRRGENDLPEFMSNNTGGILGGISSGQAVIVKTNFKATPSIRIKGSSIDIDGKSTEISTHGRHDPCVGIRAVPVVEAMAALVLLDSWMMDSAQNHL